MRLMNLGTGTTRSPTRTWHTVYGHLLNLLATPVTLCKGWQSGSKLIPALYEKARLQHTVYGLMDGRLETTTCGSTGLSSGLGRHPDRLSTTTLLRNASLSEPYNSAGSADPPGVSTCR